MKKQKAVTKPARIHIFQIDHGKLRQAAGYLSRSFLKGDVTGVDVAAAIDQSLYRHAWTVDVPVTSHYQDEAAVEQAMAMTKSLVKKPKGLISRITAARPTGISDLLLLEGSGAYIAADKLFLPYFGPLPHGFELALQQG